MLVRKCESFFYGASPPLEEEFMAVYSSRMPSVLVLCASMAVASTAQAAGRAADKILADYNAIQLPADAGKGGSPAASVEARTKLERALNRRSELALELYKAHPDHPQVAKLMASRWEHRLTDPKKAVDVNVEADGVLAKSKNADLLKEAAYAKAMLSVRRNSKNPDVAMAAIDEFIKRSPKDERGATLLNNLAAEVSDADRRDRIHSRLAAAYPDSVHAGEIKSILAAKATGGSAENGVGKPFVLEFTDAINGKPVSIKGLKGKVVVIDFWATWCPPCVAEMPKMKKLYAEYKGKGVEFIGVSLDQSKEKGGLDSLKKFVAENDITWPQYYQGNFWQSDFSKAWGINSIPCVFLIDADGRLVNTKARGRLEELIPEQLAKAKKLASR
jgi:thiol-disulfide isomerase/thioredoxin